MIEIIPAIDIIDARCVRLSQGDYEAKTVYDVDPVDMVKRYADAGLTRIHAVDLDGAKARTPRNLPTLERMASVAGVAIEWGGGLNDDADLKSAFNAGVSYAVIGSVAARSPELFEQWLSQYGSERMVLGADVRNGRVAVAGWLETEDATVDQLVDRFTEAGLSQAIVTEISRDGMLSGPEFALYERLQTKYTDVDFTISGGVSSIDDVVRANDLGLRRIIIGKAIYEGRITLKQLEHLL